MILGREKIDNAVTAVHAATTPEELSVIRTPSCAAALWHREPRPAFQEWIDTLDPGHLPRGRMILRPASVRSAVARICEACGTPAGAERDHFADDVAALSGLFAKLMRAEWLRLRLDVVATNACRRFHIDRVTARLVCTYRGTGTQYGVAAIGGELDPVLTVPTGAPILLRGTLWPEDPQSGIRHRSPPIEGTGETRSVLVLDPLDNPEDEPDSHGMQ
ncbi:MAG: DUF1826 domain-containing protein [Pseudomonadota bacterium]